LRRLKFGLVLVLTFLATKTMPIFLAQLVKLCSPVRCSVLYIALLAIFIEIKHLLNLVATSAFCFNQFTIVLIVEIFQFIIENGLIDFFSNIGTIFQNIASFIIKFNFPH